MAFLDIARAGGRRAAVAQGLFALAWLGFGAWQGFSALRSQAAEARLAPTLNREALWAGRTAGAVNHIMAHELPVDPVLRGAGGLLRWGVFGSGGPQARVGCDGWLYLTEELRPWDQAEAAMAERAQGLVRLQRALAARGITLLVAITPDKARIHPEHLCGAPLSAQARGRHAAFTALFEAAGGTQVETLAPLLAARTGGDLWLRTDSHWNQRGAALVAQRIAAAARPLPLERPGHFSTLRSRPAPVAGDLLRIMNLDMLPDPWRPAPDLVAPARTTAPEATGGLLDEAPAPQIVLLGSSYSLNGNFHGALQEALGAPVANFAQAGGGFAGSALRYFASPAWRENPPKLIIWEVLERALPQPLSAEERAFLVSAPAAR
jgi:alginate O-acetyltransferase complex protein AlgJ